MTDTTCDRLIAAHDRIAELEAENERLQARLDSMQGVVERDEALQKANERLRAENERMRGFLAIPTDDLRDLVWYASRLKGVTLTQHVLEWAGVE